MLTQISQEYLMQLTSWARNGQDPIAAVTAEEAAEMERKAKALARYSHVTKESLPFLCPGDREKANQIVIAGACCCIICCCQL